MACGYGIERSPRTPLPAIAITAAHSLTTAARRKSPRSAPAAQSSTSVPSSVPRST
jgi:hypothetical protein